MMGKRIVVASDSFKGSLSSLAVGQAISRGIKALYPDDDVSVYPIADGGEGTVEAILANAQGQERVVTVQGPLGQPVRARYGLIDQGKTAVIEMAEASGITLVATENRSLMQSSTYGTGQLLLDALEQQVTKIYLGLGGSATNDGGLGLLAALGVRFLDGSGKVLEPIAANLAHIARIDVSGKNRALDAVDVVLLHDVTNPLCGENGATLVYGPQKGGHPQDLQELDRSMAAYAHLAECVTGRQVKDSPGAGAAGGLGFALMAFFQVQSEAGIDRILDLIGISKAMAVADLVITGEGHMDGQSKNGKAPFGVAKLAQAHGLPTVAIVGSSSIASDESRSSGISGVFAIVSRPMTLNEAMADASSLVTNTAKQVIQFYHRLSDGC